MKILSWLCYTLTTIYRNRFTVPRAMERLVTYTAFYIMLEL